MHYYLNIKQSNSVSSFLVKSWDLSDNGIKFLFLTDFFLKDMRITKYFFEKEIAYNLRYTFFIGNRKSMFISLQCK